MSEIERVQLIEIVKQILGDEQYCKLEEVYDGTYFHLTPSELSLLMNKYAWRIVNEV